MVLIVLNIATESLYFLYFTLIVILSWIVDKQVANDVIHGSLPLIEEEHVEYKPERIPHSILDAHDYICLVCRYFSEDAWLLLNSVIKTKNETMVWTCQVCYHDLHSGEASSIICDACLLWYHFCCVGLKAQPKGTQWFCRPCHSLFKNS